MIYNKLVRDRIPEIIMSSGRRCDIDYLDKKEYLIMLESKLDEKLAEFHKEQNVEELADLLEVIYATAIALGYSIEELEAVRRKKVDERRGFEKRVILKEVFEN